VLESEGALTLPSIELKMQSLPVPQEFRGRRILVADDNAFNRTIIQQMLAMAGIEVVLAGNGEDACAKLTDADPDLVFMDVRMPGMNGMEATQIMRNAGFSRPIVGISAATSNADQIACKSAGMNDFLAKPIDADELWGCLTRWLCPCKEPEARFVLTEEAAGNAAEARFLGNRESLARAYAAFIACHSNDRLQMQNMLAEGNYTGMANMAHALKGSAATIGLDVLEKLAMALEKKIQSQADTEDLLQLIDWIDVQLKYLVEKNKMSIVRP